MICAHCGRPIFVGRSPGVKGDAWLHEAADGMKVRSCRAATYEPGRGWAVDYPKHLKALPRRRAMRRPFVIGERPVRYNPEDGSGDTFGAVLQTQDAEGWVLIGQEGPMNHPRAGRWGRVRAEHLHRGKYVWQDDPEEETA